MVEEGKKREAEPDVKLLAELLKVRREKRG